MFPSRSGTLSNSDSSLGGREGGIAVKSDIRPSDWVKWFSISSNVLLFVSGTRKMQNSKPTAEIADYSQKTP